MEPDLQGRPTTDRQDEILRWIRAYLRKHGCPPTLRETARAFGIASTNGISDHVSALRRRGLLVQSDAHRRSRTLLPTVPDGCCPACGQPLPKENP